MAPDFPAMHSTIMAMVIREGKPCGLKTMSGTRPDSLHGRSSEIHFLEQMPFWPALEANLSPTEAARGILRQMETLSLPRVPVSLPHSFTESTNATSLYSYFLTW